MKVHELKIWPTYFGQLRAGQKTFEIRKDDRPFRWGDLLIQNEWNPEKEEYTGQSETSLVLGVTRAAPGLKPGYVILSIKSVPYTGPTLRRCELCNRLRPEYKLALPWKCADCLNAEAT